MKFKEDFTFPVYIKEKVIKDIEEICKKYDYEVFGYLVGELFLWKGQNYIIINNYLYKEESSSGNEYNVKEQGETGVAVDDRDIEDKISFNFMEYAGEFDNLKKKANKESLLRLGWFHSHPDFGCFLSSTDLATQREIFSESYHVALVVDPIRDYYKFFTLDNNSNKGYKELNYAIIS